MLSDGKAAPEDEVGHVVLMEAEKRSSRSSGSVQADSDDLKDSLLDTGLYTEEPKQWRLCFSRSSCLPYFNTVCTMAGTGILQLPYTLRQSGWMALLIIVVAAVMTNYTAKAIVKCMYAVSNSASPT